MNLNKNLLCLKWDEFDRFVVGGLSNLYQKDDMADTTLFCDGRSFKAHKVVLSIWSSYFREIFTTTPHAHPVIVLRETTSSDLELILRFIYQGQLFVPFEDTERFLKTAEYFQIAGLRDMRVHLSPSDKNFAGGSSSPNNGTHIIGSNISGGSGASASISQSFMSPATSYALHNNINTSMDGIPIQILNNSTSSSISQQGEHSSAAINPISIVTTNSPSTQFSTNVIKPIPSRQPTRLTQPVISPNATSIGPNPVYNNLPNPTNRQSQEFVYSTQPILIVHNQQKPNEYHEIASSKADARPDQMLVMERVGNYNNESSVAVEKKISPGEPPNSAADETIMNNNYHQPEEVLGLEYLHENHARPSTHSHIIHEAAVAAGVAVEDNEMMEINRDSSYASSDSINSTGKSSKINANVVLTSTTSTPVYAVKRLPIPSTASEGSKAGSSSTAKRSNFRSNHKRKRRMSSQNANIELVSCPKCDKMVKKTSLKVHITRTHLEEGTVLVCPICNKQISSKGVYYKHMYGHRQKAADVKFKPNSECTNSTQSSIGGNPNESRT